MTKTALRRVIASLVIALMAILGITAAAPAQAAQLGKICVVGSSDAGVSYRNYGSNDAWQKVGIGKCVWIASTKTVAHGQGTMTLTTTGFRVGPGATIVVGPPVTNTFYVDR